MASYSLGYSPCPNDTFIFYALTHGEIPEAPNITEVLEDIETLNTLAMEAQLDLTKISFHALAHLREQYCLLHAGGALGRGCGPLVVAREARNPRDLKDARIAIPGKLTTAALLLQLFDHHIQDMLVFPFDQIMDAVRRGEVDAGVIIHESRFTYPAYGLRSVIDLGEWWERETGHPIPLGGILARREIGHQQIEYLDQCVLASAQFAQAHPHQVRQYIRNHAQEMDDAVIQAHVDLYVNAHTLDYGVEGRAAIGELLQRAERAGLVPSSRRSLFAEGPRQLGPKE